MKVGKEKECDDGGRRQKWVSIDSLPPKKPLMDAEAMAELDAGMQKGVDEDGGVQIAKMEESSASPPLSKEDENNIHSQYMHVPPVDQASAILPPLQECDKLAPIQDEGGSGESKVTADDWRVDIEPKVRQGEAPVEVEQEPDVEAAAEIEQEPDVEAPLDNQPNASDPLETEPLRQDLLKIQPDPRFLDDFKPDQHVVDELESSRSRRELRMGDADVGFITITPKDGEFELGRVDPSVPEEANIAEPQTHFVDDATELSCMAEENQEHVNDTAGPFSQEQILDPNVGGPAVDKKISLEEAGEGVNDSQGAPQLVDTDEGDPGVSVEKLSSEEAGEGTNDSQEGALPLVDTDEGNPGASAEKLSSEKAGEGTNALQQVALVDTDESNPGVSVEHDSAEPPVSKELNERVDQESLTGIVLDEPSTAPVSHEYALTKEPSLSTPDMEALTDVDNKERLHKQESCESLEDSAQCLDAEDKHEESAGGGSAEGTSNEPEVKVDSNEQEKAENNAFDQDVPLAAAADSACEVLAPSGQELMTDMPPADEQDGKDQELGNDAPFVFEQDLGTEECAVNKEPRFEPYAEQELDIEAPNSAEREPFEKNVDSGSSSIELEMAAETHKNGEEAVHVVAEKDDINEEELGLEASSIKQAEDVRGVAAVSAPVEDAITSNLDEVISENEPGGLALNSEQGIDNPDMKDASLVDVSGSHGKQSDTVGLSSKQENSVVQSGEEEETTCPEDEVKIDGFNEQIDEHDPNKRLQDEQGCVKIIPCSNNVTEANYSDKNCEQDRQDISRTSIPTQFEHTANGNPNDVLESSVTPEASNEIRLSAHMFHNGDSLQSFPCTDKGEKAEGSHVGLSTEPVVELGKVCDGMNKLEAPITVLENGMIYHGSVIQDGKYIPPEPLTYNSENKDESNVLSASGTQSVKTEDKDLNAGAEREIMGGSNGIAADMDAIDTSKPLVLENDGDLLGTEYMNGLASASIADRTYENAEAFHNGRSREVSLSLVVLQQRDALENVNNKRTTESVTIARQTNWWGCCGMLDLLLHKD